jgi:DNA polymerase III epsilon subunit-like protein
MTRYAVLDTETNGLPNYKLPADDPAQPRLAELAMVLLDEKFNVLSKLRLLVKPDGWQMTAEATAINNLTDEILAKDGVPILDAIIQYRNVIESGFVLAAYNAQHDLKVMRGEMRRAGLDDLFERTPNVCLMRASTGVCKIERMAPGGGFKFPKLSEACKFFGVEQGAAHSAEDDTRCAVEILKALAARDALPEAAVHYAKNHPTEKKDAAL